MSPVSNMISCKDAASYNVTVYLRPCARVLVDGKCDLLSTVVLIVIGQMKFVTNINDKLLITKRRIRSTKVVYYLLWLIFQQ